MSLFLEEKDREGLFDGPRCFLPGVWNALLVPAGRFLGTAKSHALK
jgi:hypothetical protein